MCTDLVVPEQEIFNRIFFSNQLHIVRIKILCNSYIERIMKTSKKN